MGFDYSAKNAAFVRQHGRCAKCGKYLNMVYEDRRGHDGAWTAHDLVPMDEGGSSRAHNCVILCITDPDCHLNFAHGGDLRQRVFLTPFAFPGWVFRDGGGQERLEEVPAETQRPVHEARASVVPYRVPRTGDGPWMTPSAAASVRPLTRPGLGSR
jgi:hypothetical protein